MVSDKTHYSVQGKMKKGKRGVIILIYRDKKKRAEKRKREEWIKYGGRYDKNKNKNKKRRSRIYTLGKKNPDAPQWESGL